MTTRRDFLKYSALAVAATSGMPGFWPAPRPRRRATARKPWW
ncbi:twin-arginine translocation signal domain-containing protein [Deinococcus malanensis]